MTTDSQNKLTNFLNACVIVQDESYNGHSLIDTTGEKIASYDGNWNNTELPNEIAINESETIELDQAGKLFVSDYLMQN